MSNSIQITTDRLPHPKVRGNARGNLRYRNLLIAEERQYMGELLSDLMLENRPYGPYKKAKATFNYWNNREIDWDNFLIGCKAWMDAIVEAGILVDDKPSVLSIVLDSWHKCKKGEEKVVIKIEERE